MLPAPFIHAVAYSFFDTLPSSLTGYAVLTIFAVFYTKTTHPTILHLRHFYCSY